MTNDKTNAANPESTAAKLQAMARNAAIRTKYARFLDLFVDVETALSAGVQHEVVRLQLVEDGLDLSPATFKTYLQRARGERSRRATPKPAAPTDPSTERQPEPDPERGKTPTDDESEWNPQAIAGLRNKPVDLAALARAARDASKGRTTK
jgi:hypothetical protein